MSTGKKIVLSTFGSFGDIHPYIAIALELKARGHSVVIATSDVYREKMDALGIELHRVRPNLPSYDEPDELSRLSVELMKPRGGTEKVIELLTPNLREVYEDLDAAVAKADLVLSRLWLETVRGLGPDVLTERTAPAGAQQRAPIAQAPGRSTSTRGQSSSTRDTTGSKARAASGSAVAGQSGHHSTSTRAGGRPAVVTRRLAGPVWAGRSGPLGPPSRPGPVATATASAAAPRPPGRPPRPAPAGPAAARDRAGSRPTPGG